MARARYLKTSNDWKTQLASEGCFDAERKKPLPPLPRRIGIITSPTGAVAHDITTVLTRRWPLAALVFIPAKVQGFDAAEDLRRALTWAEIYGDLDVVIMARGGGSIEDLWCFNDEQLVRDAANFPLPLISAIGHENRLHTTRLCRRCARADSERGGGNLSHRMCANWQRRLADNARDWYVRWPGRCRLIGSA